MDLQALFDEVGGEITGRNAVRWVKRTVSLQEIGHRSFGGGSFRIDYVHTIDPGRILPLLQAILLGLPLPSVYVHESEDGKTFIPLDEQSSLIIGVAEKVIEMKRLETIAPFFLVVRLLRAPIDLIRFQGAYSKAVEYHELLTTKTT